MIEVVALGVLGVLGLLVRLSRDDVRERLIAVLCGHPESVIRTDRVDWVVTDGALDPEARVRSILELAALLDWD